ncbi:hypothetical protein EIN_185430 [Entamoeba invadens IP1]|uniref:hypothetical protein n=1 Tax=Entamoeba invadens IP1 TaxID=370355 RepID=UPI0002C3CEDB|nr:hypothetical protein EIN_185430 [Entamoeba invadens IP1]ELP94156.1 hypothetical protein EIN_185430 [Entamoeba invadens IP1]|eukprot:XP_004260927.1 hypothetical protein EIN_185430 [Entamoeba invadens IP1]
MSVSDDSSQYERDNVVEWTAEEIETLAKNVRSYPEGDYSEFKRLTLLLTKLPRKRLRDVSSRLEYYKAVETNPTLTWKDFYLDSKASKQKRLDTYSPRSSSSDNEDEKPRRRKSRSRSKSKDKKKDQETSPPFSDKDSQNSANSAEIERTTKKEEKDGKRDVKNTKRQLPIVMSECPSRNTRKSFDNDFKDQSMFHQGRRSGDGSPRDRSFQTYQNTPTVQTIQKVSLTQIPLKRVQQQEQKLLNVEQFYNYKMINPRDITDNNEKILDFLLQTEFQSKIVDLEATEAFLKNVEDVIALTDQMTSPMKLPVIFTCPISINEIKQRIIELNKH